jgi:hypothetical protein
MWLTFFWGLMSTNLWRGQCSNQSVTSGTYYFYLPRLYLLLRVVTGFVSKVGGLYCVLFLSLMIQVLLCSCLRVILDQLDTLTRPEVNASLHELGFQVWQLLWVSLALLEFVSFWGISFLHLRKWKNIKPGKSSREGGQSVKLHCYVVSLLFRETDGFVMDTITFAVDVWAVRWSSYLWSNGGASLGWEVRIFLKGAFKLLPVEVEKVI